MSQGIVAKWVMVLKIWNIGKFTACSIECRWTSDFQCCLCIEKCPHAAHVMLVLGTVQSSLQPRLDSFYLFLHLKKCLGSQNFGRKGKHLDAWFKSQGWILWSRYIKKWVPRYEAFLHQCPIVLYPSFVNIWFVLYYDYSHISFI